MTKKHFIELADRIREWNYHPPYYMSVPFFHKDHLKFLADFCKSQNPRFNRERWLDYIDGKCGPSGGRVK